MASTASNKAIGLLGRAGAGTGEDGVKAAWRSGSVFLSDSLDFFLAAMIVYLFIWLWTGCCLCNPGGKQTY
jgi:hypothetical protein